MADKSSSLLDLAQKAQHVKRAKDFISTLKESAKIAGSLVEVLIGSIKSSLSADGEFVDTQALRVAERLTVKGEALDALLKNQALFDSFAAAVADKLKPAVTTAVTDALRPGLENLVKTETCKISIPSPRPAPSASEIADAVLTGATFTTKLQDTVQNHLGSAAFTPTLKSAAETAVKDKMAQAHQQPQAALGQEDRKVLDAFGEYRHELEAVAKNVRVSTLVTVLLGENCEDDVYDMLHEKPYATLENLRHLSKMDRTELEDLFENAISKDPAYSNRNPSGLQNLITDAYFRVGEMYSKCMTRAVALALHGTKGYDLDELANSRRDQMLNSLNAIASNIATQYDLECALVTAIPKPTDPSSAITWIRDEAKLTLDKFLESQFADALKGNDPQSDLAEIMRIAPEATLDKLMRCATDTRYLETIVGSNLSTDPMFQGGISGVYKNLLTETIGVYLDQSVAYDDGDPLKKIDPLSMAGHDTVSILMDIATGKTSTRHDSDVQEAKKCLITGIVSCGYDTSYTVINQIPARPVNGYVSHDKVFDDNELTLELLLAVHNMNDADFEKHARFSSYAHEGAIASETKRGLSQKYLQMLDYKVFDAISGPDYDTISKAVDGLRAVHGREPVDSSLKSMRMSGDALIVSDRNGSLTTTDDQIITLQRRAAVFLYPMHSISYVADAIALDDSPSHVKPEDEIQFVYGENHFTTVSHLALLQDPMTLRMQLEIVTGKPVDDALFAAKADFVSDCYKSLLVTMTIKTLDDRAHQKFMDAIKTAHPSAYKETLRYVVSNPELVKTEIAARLTEQPDSEAVKTAGRKVMLRAEDYLYGPDSGTRVAASVLDRDEVDLETLFKRNPGNVVAHLRDLRGNEGTLRRELTTVLGGEPANDIVRSTSEYVSDIYLSELVSYMALKLDTTDHRPVIKKIASEHPRDWVEALRFIDKNPKMAEAILKTYYGPSYTESVLQHITLNAAWHLQVYDMKQDIARAVSLYGGDVSPAILSICKGNLDAGALALQDLSRLLPENLNDAMSEATGTTGTYASNVLVSKMEAIQAAYIGAVSLLVVRSQLHKAPDERMEDYSAISREHEPNTSTAVSSLLSNKKLIRSQLEQLAQFGNWKMSSSEIKATATAVHEMLGKIPLTRSA